MSRTRDKEFDVLNVPLDNYENLIEASAGTGKTYNIALMFLRLVIEKKYSVTRILVVTFTNAATAELKNRIRSFILTAYRFLQFGDKTQNEAIVALVKKYCKDKEETIKILKEAIIDIDELSVFTIHGFCQRLLRENAFESGILFDSELIKNTDQLVDMNLVEFWRENIEEESNFYVDFLYKSKIKNPFSFKELINEYLKKSGILIQIEYNEVEFSEIFNKFDDLKEIWNDDKDSIKSILLEDKILSRTAKNGYKPVDLQNKFSLLEDVFKNKNTSGADILQSFSALALEENSKPSMLKKGKSIEEHNFFDECDKFSILANDYIYYLRYKALNYVIQRLDEQKDKLGILSFNDLLVKLYKSIKTEHGKHLICNAQKKYDTVLIDEFQDTDKLQYEIFTTLFKDKSLFFIGDPKQSIYQFRGADIFSYINAAQKVSNKYTLSTNWRSSQKMINAVNDIFKSVDKPFYYDDINFKRSLSPDSAENLEIEIDSQNENPLIVWQNSSAKNIKQLIRQNIAFEIEKLLDLSAENKAFLVDGELKKPILISDIAVLVLSHRDANLIKNELDKRNIPSTVNGAMKINETDEMQDIKILLEALVNSSDNYSLKTLLLTPLFGKKISDIADLTEENKQDDLEKYHQKLLNYNEIFKKSGFYALFDLIDKENDLAKRMLNYKNGKRKYANYLQIAEMIHQNSFPFHFSLEIIADKLQDLVKNISQDEDDMLRTDNDLKTVQIVTVHSSKGLEYNIVFAPLLVKKPNDVAFPVYHEDNEMKINLKTIVSKDKKTPNELYKEEQIAESLRLFYVAITRAKYRCYLAKINVKGADTLNNFFENSLESEFITTKDIDEVKYSKIVKQDLNNNSLNDLIYNDFIGNISQKWKVHSFSSLSSNKYEAEKDIDKENDLIVKNNEILGGIFALEKGARTGIALHEVFEKIDFCDNSRHKETIENVLEYYHLSNDENKENITNIVFEMVENVLGCDLNSSQLKLTNIPNSDRLNELEFYFKIDNLKKSYIQKLNNNKDIFKFDFLNGYIHGFIDLVFVHNGKYYIVDWKSNFLGGNKEDYNEEKLKEAMDKHNYYLQYNIYVLAVVKYLKEKIPNFDYETMFGGVFYIFLRGVEKGSKTGIFFDKPEGYRNK